MTKFLITLLSVFSLPYYLLAITLEQVQERYLEMQSFRGNFLQTTIVENEDRRASASGIIAYLRGRWIAEVGHVPASGPAFIVYDDRFHANYRTFGCSDGEYLGTPIATLYIPVTDAGKQE